MNEKEKQKIKDEALCCSWNLEHGNPFDQGTVLRFDSLEKILDAMPSSAQPEEAKFVLNVDTLRRAMPKVSKHFGTIYDVDNDADFKVDRLDHIESEEVLAYVPQASPYRNIIIQAIADCIEDLGTSDPDPTIDQVPASP